MTPRAALWVLAAALTLTSAVLLEARRDTRDAIAATVGASDRLTDSLAAATLTAEVDRVRLALERARAGSEGGATLHLALAVGTGGLSLERGDVTLRAMTVTGTLPRGTHTVVRVAADAIDLGDGLGLRARPAGAGDAAAPTGTLWLAPGDFEALRGALSRGARCYVY